MALSAAEQQELEELETIFAQQEQPITTASSRLSPEEQQELDELEAMFAQQQVQGDDLDLGFDPSLKEEQHPEFSGTKAFKTRAVYKNLVADPEAGFNYLQQQYPGFNFKKADGRVFMKKPSDKEWYAMDPSGFDWEDITDIGYDVGSAVLETGAGIAGGVVGGLGGTAAMPGAGTIAGGLGGAALAGGSTAAGLEALRQSLGTSAGIPQEQDLGQVGMAAGFGAAAPLLFGTGAAAKHVAKPFVMKEISKKLGKRAMAKTGQGMEELAEVIARKQAGAIPGAYAKVKGALPAAGAATSGVSKETLEWGSRNIDDVLETEAKGLDLVDEFGRLADEIEENQAKRIDNLGQQLTKKLDEFGENAHLSEGHLDVIFKDMDDLLEKYERDVLEELEISSIDLLPQKVKDLAEEGSAIPQAVADYNEVKTVIGAYRPTKALAGDQIVKRKKMLNDLTNIARDPRGDKITKRVQGEIQAKAKMTVKALDKKMKNIDEGLTPIYEEFTKSFKDEAIIKKYFRDTTDMGVNEKAYKTLGTILNPKKEPVRQIIENLDEALETSTLAESTRLGHLSRLMNPTLTPLSSGGTTSTSRSMLLQSLGAGVGFGMGQDVGGGYGPGLVGGALGGAGAAMLGGPAAMRKYMLMNKSLTAPYRKMLAPGAQPAQYTRPAYQAGIRAWENMAREQEKK